MALFLCMNDDCTGIVSDLNPLVTKHTSNGEPVTISAYIFNDGKRKNVPNDQNPPPLIYTNVQVKVEGVSYTLEQALTPSNSDVTLYFDGIDGWNIGTVIKSGLERMRVEEILTNKSVRVQRNYTADGVASTISGHNIGEVFIADATSVTVALPNITDYTKAGTFLDSIIGGLEPTSLSNALTNQESNNIVRSSRADRYSEGCIIKIDNEQMKVISISGSDMTVLRGYNGTSRAVHNANATITLVGINDINKTHKIFIKNDPPSGLNGSPFI